MRRVLLNEILSDDDRCFDCHSSIHLGLLTLTVISQTWLSRTVLSSHFKLFKRDFHSVYQPRCAGGSNCNFPEAKQWEKRFTIAFDYLFRVERKRNITSIIVARSHRLWGRSSRTRNSMSHHSQWLPLACYCHLALYILTSTTDHCTPGQI